MATEMARYAVIGAIIGVLFFAVLFGFMYFAGPHYTDEQKVEINKGFDNNCTKCLVQDNSTCTVDTIQRTQWGALCNTTWTTNCTSACRRLT